MTRTSTPEGCALQSLEKGVGRKKVWCLDINALACGENGFLKTEHEIAPLVDGSGCDELHRYVAGIGIISFSKGPYVRVGTQEIPIDREAVEHRLYDGSADTKVCIAPYSSVGSRLHISVSDVHTSDITNFAIDNRDFSVVAPVDAIGELTERHLKERVSINTETAHFPEKGIGSGEGTNMIVEHLNLNTLGGFAGEKIEKPIADPVVAVDIILDEDILPRVFNIFHKVYEFLLP